MQQQKPLEGAQLVIMTIALSLATFMQVLDSTIANVAIPTIAGNLGSSLSQGTWVITSFGSLTPSPSRSPAGWPSASAR
ncbi:Multidrug resistance protein B [Serratia liquefaciens]|nr:Multidrug resistance protein B [Serratia liquefaciens]